MTKTSRISSRFGRRAVAWLLTLMLLVGQNLAAPVPDQSSGLWNDICSAAGNHPQPLSGNATQDHWECVFHCSLGAAAMLPDLPSVIGNGAFTSADPNRPAYESPPDIPARAAHPARAPPPSFS